MSSRPLEIAAWSILIVILGLLIVVLVLGFVARKPCAVPPVLVAALAETRRRQKSRRTQLKRIADATRNHAAKLAASEPALQSATAAIDYKNKPVKEVVVPVLDEAQVSQADTALKAMHYVPDKQSKLLRSYTSPDHSHSVAVKLPTRDADLDAHMKGLSDHRPLGKDAQEAVDTLTNMTDETYFAHGSMFKHNRPRTAAPYSLRLPHSG